MIVLGLDLSLTSPGFAVFGHDGKLVRTSAVQYEPDRKAMTRTKKGSKTLTNRQKIERLIYIRDKVKEMVVEHVVEAVAIEGYAFSKFSSSVTGLAELGGVVRVELLERFGIDPMILPVTSCRRFLVGSDKVSKSDAQDWLKRQGMRFDTEDEGDAFIVGLTGFYVAHPDLRGSLDMKRLEQIDAITGSVSRRSAEQLRTA